MGSYWFLEPLADVTAVSIEVDMERVLCLPHVLQFAYPALDEVDNMSCFRLLLLVRGGSGWW